MLPLVFLFFRQRPRPVLLDELHVDLLVIGHLPDLAHSHLPILVDQALSRRRYCVLLLPHAEAPSAAPSLPSMHPPDLALPEPSHALPSGSHSTPPGWYRPSLHLHPVVSSSPDHQACQSLQSEPHLVILEGYSIQSRSTLDYQPLNPHQVQKDLPRRCSGSTKLGTLVSSSVYPCPLPKDNHGSHASSEDAPG